MNVDKVAQFVVRTLGWTTIMYIAAPQSGWAITGIILGVIMSDIKLVDE